MRKTKLLRHAYFLFVLSLLECSMSPQKNDPEECKHFDTEGGEIISLQNTNGTKKTSTSMNKLKKSRNEYTKGAKRGSVNLAPSALWELRRKLSEARGSVTDENVAEEVSRIPTFGDPSVRTNPLIIRTYHEGQDYRKATVSSDPPTAEKFIFHLDNEPHSSSDDNLVDHNDDIPYIKQHENTKSKYVVNIDDEKDEEKYLKYIRKSKSNEDADEEPDKTKSETSVKKKHEKENNSNYDNKVTKKEKHKSQDMRKEYDYSRNPKNEKKEAQMSSSLKIPKSEDPKLAGVPEEVYMGFRPSLRKPFSDREDQSIRDESKEESIKKNPSEYVKYPSPKMPWQKELVATQEDVDYLNEHAQENDGESDGMNETTQVQSFDGDRNISYVPSIQTQNATNYWNSTSDTKEDNKFTYNGYTNNTLSKDPDADMVMVMSKGDVQRNNAVYNESEKTERNVEQPETNNGDSLKISEQMDMLQGKDMQGVNKVRPLSNIRLSNNTNDIASDFMAPDEVITEPQMSSQSSTQGHTNGKVNLQKQKETKAQFSNSTLKDEDVDKYYDAADKSLVVKSQPKLNNSLSYKEEYTDNNDREYDKGKQTILQKTNSAFEEDNLDKSVDIADTSQSSQDNLDQASQPIVNIKIKGGTYNAPSESAIISKKLKEIDNRAKNEPKLEEKKVINRVRKYRPLSKNYLNNSEELAANDLDDIAALSSDEFTKPSNPDGKVSLASNNKQITIFTSNKDEDRLKSNEVAKEDNDFRKKMESYNSFLTQVGKNPIDTDGCLRSDDPLQCENKEIIKSSHVINQLDKELSKISSSAINELNKELSRPSMENRLAWNFDKIKTRGSTNEKNNAESTTDDLNNDISDESQSVKSDNSLPDDFGNDLDEPEDAGLKITSTHKNKNQEKAGVEDRESVIQGYKTSPFYQTNENEHFSFVPLHPKTKLLSQSEQYNRSSGNALLVNHLIKNGPGLLPNDFLYAKDKLHHFLSEERRKQLSILKPDLLRKKQTSIKNKYVQNQAGKYLLAQKQKALEINLKKKKYYAEKMKALSCRDTLIKLKKFRSAQVTLPFGCRKYLKPIKGENNELIITNPSNSFKDTGLITFHKKPINSFLSKNRDDNKYGTLLYKLHKFKELSNPKKPETTYISNGKIRVISRHKLNRQNGDYHGSKKIISLHSRKLEPYIPPHPKGPSIVFNQFSSTIGMQHALIVSKDDNLRSNPLVTRTHISSRKAKLTENGKHAKKPVVSKKLKTKSKLRKARDPHDPPRKTKSRPSGYGYGSGSGYGYGKQSWGWGGGGGWAGTPPPGGIPGIPSSGKQSSAASATSAPHMPPASSQPASQTTSSSAAASQPSSQTASSTAAASQLSSQTSSSAAAASQPSSQTQFPAHQTNVSTTYKGKEFKGNKTYVPMKRKGKSNSKVQSNKKKINKMNLTKTIKANSTNTLHKISKLNAVHHMTNDQKSKSSLTTRGDSPSKSGPNYGYGNGNGHGYGSNSWGWGGGGGWAGTPPPGGIPSPGNYSPPASTAPKKPSPPVETSQEKMASSVNASATANDAQSKPETPAKQNATIPQSLLKTNESINSNKTVTQNITNDKLGSSKFHFMQDKHQKKIILWNKTKPEKSVSKKKMYNKHILNTHQKKLTLKTKNNTLLKKRET